MSLPIRMEGKILQLWIIFQPILRLFTIKAFALAVPYAWIFSPSSCGWLPLTFLRLCVLSEKASPNHSYNRSLNRFLYYFGPQNPFVSFITLKILYLFTCLLSSSPCVPPVTLQAP